MSVCLYMERNKDKVSFVFAVFRWVFFLSEWTVSALSLSLSLSLCNKAAWILRLVPKVWTSLNISHKPNCKVILDCNATAKHAICLQVLGHDSFHG